MSEFQVKPTLSEEAVILFDGLRQFMAHTKLLTMEQQMANDMLKPYRSDIEHTAADEFLSQTIEQNVNLASDFMADLHKKHGMRVFAPLQESSSAVNLVAVHGLGYDADEHRYYGLSKRADDSAVRCDIMAQEVVCQPGSQRIGR